MEAVSSVGAPSPVQAAGWELGLRGHGRPRRPEIERFRLESQVSSSSS